MSSKPKDKKHTIREQVEVQHQFDASEYKSKSETLAQLLADIDLKTESVKAAAASAKAVIKELASQVSELANQLRLGVETRIAQADCEMDRKTGMKTVRFADGPNKGKVIRKVAMTEDEVQMLPLEDRPKTDPKDGTAAATTAANSEAVAELVGKLTDGSAVIA